MKVVWHLTPSKKVAISRVLRVQVPSLAPKNDKYRKILAVFAFNKATEMIVSGALVLCTLLSHIYLLVTLLFYKSYAIIHNGDFK